MSKVRWKQARVMVVLELEEVEERECRDIKITFVDTEGEEDITTLQQNV